jgi:hypothetical protein
MLGELRVSMSYSGMLEGVPSEKKNSDISERAIEEAKRFWPGEQVHLIEPVVTWRDTPEGYQHVRGPENPELPEFLWRGPKYPELPEFLCIGLFMSFSSRDPNMHGSVMAVVWLQSQSPVEGIKLDADALKSWERARDFES